MMRYVMLNMLGQPNTCTSVLVMPPNNRGKIQTSTLGHQKVERLKKRKFFYFTPIFIVLVVLVHRILPIIR